MLKKILLIASVFSIFCVSGALAADKTYEVPGGDCKISLPENYLVRTVERKPEINNEMEVKVFQLSVSDPADKSMDLHVIVESSKLTKELPDLDYKPGEVMKNYFVENLESSGWKEPSVIDTLQNGKVHFIKFSSYIADSIGQKYDGQIYATVKDGQLLYLMLMSKERALKAEEKAMLDKTVAGLEFVATSTANVAEEK